jgi:hypothetical protein
VPLRPAQPACYDVVVFPAIDWDVGFQQPQQLAVHFACAGHRVLLVRTTFQDGPQPRCRLIADGILDVHLPRPSAFRPSSGCLDEPAVAALLDTFEGLCAQYSMVDAACVVGLPLWGPLALALWERYGWKVIYTWMDGTAAAAAERIAIAAARGDYLVLLNNDTVVTRSWLSRLIFHLRDSQIGMIGPVTNASGNESRIEVAYRTLEDMEAFAERYTRAHLGQTFEIRMLALFCAALRRAVLDAVGPLDERFGIGMFEDDDYALRLRRQRYRLLCAEDVFVHHWGSASFSQLSDVEYARVFDENRRAFEAKWGVPWEPHRYRAAG